MNKRKQDLPVFKDFTNYNFEGMDDDEKNFLESRGVRVLNMISDNGTSQVYTASSQNIEISLALKRINLKNVKMAILQRINAINESMYVNIYQKYTYNGNLYLLMEYCRYDLSHLIKNGPEISGKNMSKYIRLCIQAVKACHDAQFFGLNIKPSNFLIDQYGRVKISDFYCISSHIIHNQESQATDLFTFCSPEVINRLESGSLASDIWALGCALYFISTGNYPFLHSDSVSLFDAVCHCNYDKGVISDPYLKNLISMCLQIDPNNRKPTDYLLVSDYLHQHTTREPMYINTQREGDVLTSRRGLTCRKTTCKSILAPKTKLRYKSNSAAPVCMPGIPLPSVPCTFVMN